MKKIYYAFFILGLIYSFNILGEETSSTKPTFTRLDKIIAIVNRDPITLSELDKEMDRAKKQFEQTNQPLPPPAQFRKEVLDNLIAKSLQKQLCQAKGINIKQEDVDKTVGNIAKANKLSLAQLKEAIEHTGLNYEDYLIQIKEQLALQKLQQEEVAKNVTLTPEDVKKFMRENKNQLTKYNAFHLVDVLIPVGESEPSNRITEVKKQATHLAQQLQVSKDFDVTLHQYSSAEKNDLGWRALAEVPSLFQSRVASMNINDVTAPIQAPNGFHILKLLDAKGENAKPSEAQLKGIVFQQKMQIAVKEWVQKLRNDAYVKIIN